MKEIAVVLLSGGMDSAVCAALAKKSGYEIAALHLNYGQRTEIKELECFNNLCEHFDVQHRLIVDVTHLSKIGGSSLTDMKIDVPIANLESNEIPPTYVPFRNANILAIGVSWAEVINARYIYIGAMEQDSSGYPDCRKTFFDSYNEMLKLGTKPDTKIDIITPIINNTKEDIVRIGTELGVPFSYTWSCYKNDDEACGVCDSCALRLRGFSKMGIVDPIKYSFSN